MKKSDSFYGKWIRIVENVPDTVRVKQGFGQKVVLEPKDEKTLDIKVVNDADVLTADQKLTPSGFKAIIDFIKGIPSIIGYYPALSDLVKNVVVYSVSKDTARTQKITFMIGSKVDLGNIDSSIEYLRQDEVAAAKSGTLLSTSTSTNKAASSSTTAAGFTVPVASDKIKDSTDAKLIAWIKDTWRKIDKDPIASASPIMTEVKKEVNAAKLGVSSQIFIAGLNAGYGIYDWSGKDLETGITQKLVDKVALTASVSESRLYLHPFGHRLVEAVSEQVSGFDPDAFVAEVTRLKATSTGDIIVPAGGFKEGLQNDPQMKKFQDLLVKKLDSKLANHAVYQKFKKAGAKGFLGNYGPLTKDLVYLLKAIAENPAYPNRDGSTIEPEFVAMVQAITESTGGFYLALDGNRLITEDVGSFNFAQAEVISPSPVAAAPVAAKKKGTTVVKSKGSGKIRTSDKAAGYEYAANPVKGYWTVRTKGSTDSSAWLQAQNWAAIKDLMARYPDDGAYYTIPTAGDRGGINGMQGHIFKPTNGEWQSNYAGQFDGWVKTGPISTAWLEKHYGKAADLAAGKATSSGASSGFSGELTRTQQSTIAAAIKKEFKSQLNEDIEYEGGTFEGIKFTIKLLELFAYTTYQIDINGNVTINVPEGDYDGAYTYTGKINSDLTGFTLPGAGYGGNSISWKWSDLPKKQRFRNPNNSYLSGDKLTEAILKAQEALSGSGTWVNQTLNQVWKCKTKADWKAFNKQWNSANKYDFPQWMYDDGDSLCTKALRILTEAGVIAPADYRSNRSSDSEAKEILQKYYK
jgi:hypothetical protein